MSAVALRPYLPADAQTLRRDLSLEHRGAGGRGLRRGSSARPGRRAPTTKQAFGARLAGALTLLAMIDGAVAGFASLKGADEIDMLFVDPEFARQGVGRTLVDALTKLAEARGAKRLTAEASDVAKPLFERLGFAAQQRNLVGVGDQWLANTTMAKTARGRSHAPDPAALMFPTPRLVLRSGAAGVASRRTFQTAQTPPPGACFETRGAASLLSMRELALRLTLES